MMQYANLYIVGSVSVVKVDCDFQFLVEVFVQFGLVFSVAF